MYWTYYQIIKTYFMNPFLSFLVGPYGQAFAIMDEYQFLPTENDFKEFSEEMYERFFAKHGMPSERLFQMIPPSLDASKSKDILVVKKSEIKEILSARAFVDDFASNKKELENASDMDRLNAFKSFLPFVFPKSDNNE